MWRIVVVLLVACNKGPELTEHRFAGFTIGLPPGAVSASAANRYRAGSVRAELRDYPNDPVEIRWIGTQDDGYAIADEAIAFGDSVVQVGGVSCDRRAVIVSSTFPKDVATSLHAAIVKSIKCTPEAGGNDAATIEILDLKLPEGSKREVVPGVPYSSVTYDDATTGLRYFVQVRPDSRRSRRFDLDKEAKRQTDKMRDVKIEAPEAARGALWFSAVDDQGTYQGYLVAKDCPLLQAFALVIISADEPTARAGVAQVLDSSVCLAAPR